LQIARCLGTNSITTICSKRHIDFCLSCGAAEVIDYTKGVEDIVSCLLLSPHKPFEVVMDCVSSAEPRDMSLNYPSLLQHHARAKEFLSEDYVYRRLGGPSTDWIRAGLERMTGIQWWPNRHEKLFWIRLPGSCEELQQIREWVDGGKLQPHIDLTYEFTEEGVKKAFDDLLSRRVKGKCVVKIR
jgi:NADPH:quinone reductase-like Zn-dependent oxidoreductase